MASLQGNEQSNTKNIKKQFEIMDFLTKFENCIDSRNETAKKLSLEIEEYGTTLSESTINKLLSGNYLKEISIGRLYALCCIFNISADEFLGLNIQNDDEIIISIKTGLNSKAVKKIFEINKNSRIHCGLFEKEFNLLEEITEQKALEFLLCDTNIISNIVKITQKIILNKYQNKKDIHLIEHQKLGYENIKKIKENENKKENELIMQIFNELSSDINSFVNQYNYLLDKVDKKVE